MLLIAALAIGIGYASVSGSLFVNGVVKANALPFNMHFNKFAAGDHYASLTNSPAIACADLASDGSILAKSVTLNVSGLASKGDWVEGTLTIVNNNDCDMLVSVDTVLYGTTAGSVIDSAHEYIKATATVNEPSVAVTANGGEKTVVVRVEMIDTCVLDTLDAYFTITLNGVSAS